MTASQFLAPKKSLGSLDVEAAARLITAAADIALVVDSQGVIRDLSFGNEELAKEGYSDWLGQHWAETVTVESRPKVEALLRDASAVNGSAWRHVNHPSARGADVPVLYSAIKVGKTGRVIAVGRNLRPVAVLQQRLVEVQQSLERDYARLRHAETRYRLLFQMMTEAVAIIDAASEKVMEVNPAALKLFAASAKQIAGRPFADVFDAASGRSLSTLLNKVRSAGHADEVRVKLKTGKQPVALSVSMFQHDKDAQFIARVTAVGGEPGTANSAGRSAVMRALENSPDGFVVTNGEGRLLSANRSFIDVVQCAAEEQVRGKSLAQWLGRPGADLSVLLANLRQHGSVRLFATTLRGDLGLSTEVEISAVAVPDVDAPLLGFVIRSVGRRLPAMAPADRELPRSPEQLTELIGRVPLKDIVRETTDVIERLCIEAALQLTGDNRASAADMLGLSRQSLYLKLHRYGLGELDGNG
ncbi:MAG: transcriptional regulator PpsR [Burkholderiaceae bacterium]|nr:transcriptional regulator PpsR [Burkholderiaceae bacterium]